MPFEKEIFDVYMKNVHYVGHPLLENKELCLSNTDYSEKKIDIVLDKKNIFLASKKKDITQEIINIIDSKIKWPQL